MSISAKLVNGTQKEINVPDLGITVAELKKVMAPAVDIPAEEQRLVLRGRVLKDEDILSAMGMEHGNAIHIVRSKKKVITDAAPVAATTTPATATATPASAPAITASTAPATGGAAATNPYASLFGSYSNPGSNASGGADAAGGFGMGGYSPETATEMMQNPMMMRLAQQAMQSPEFVQYMRQSNPALANMPPEAFQMAMQMMQDPAAMRQMLSLASTMGGAGTYPALGTGTTPASASAQADARTPPQGFSGFPEMFAPPTPQGNPREIYRDQLQQLLDMGFPNEEANLAALQQAQGSVSFAIERLLNS